MTVSPGHDLAAASEALAKARAARRRSRRRAVATVAPETAVDRLRVVRGGEHGPAREVGVGLVDVDGAPTGLDRHQVVAAPSRW